MRAVILALCTAVVLVGLPRLAVFFRGPQEVGKVNILTDGPRKREAEVKHASEFLAAMKKPVVQRASVASPLPANDGELIVAIEKEMARIGVYDGPITSAWTDRVRGAVRKFTGSGRTPPSVELLNSLRAAKPAMREAVVRQGATMNLQAAQDVLNGRIPPVVIVAPPEEGIPSDGYLPPWNALRAKELAQSLPAVNKGAALTVQIAAQSGRVESRRRINRARWYAGAPQRSRFSFTPYRGYFRY